MINCLASANPPQVLQMSVPIDDNDSYNDLQLDFSRKNHTFSMDNVGYITKENVDSIGNIILRFTVSYYLLFIVQKPSVFFLSF